MFWPFVENVTPPAVGVDVSLTVSADASRSVSDIGRLVPSGSHFELSSEALGLFAALREADLATARSAAARLRRLAGDAAHPHTHEAAQALGGSLRDADTCDVSALHRMCAYLIRNLLLDGIVHSVDVQGTASSAA